MINLDLKGLKCPLPVLKVRRAMKYLAEGERIMISVTDKGALRDIPDYCRQSGHQLISQIHYAEEYVFTLMKKG